MRDVCGGVTGTVELTFSGSGGFAAKVLLPAARAGGSEGVVCDAPGCCWSCAMVVQQASCFGGVFLNFGAV